MTVAEVRRWLIRVADRAADMRDQLEMDADYSGAPAEIELYEEVDKIATQAQRAVELCNEVLGAGSARRLIEEFDDDDAEDDT